MPTQAEIQASVDGARRAPRVVPKGVYRYRTHAEANADTERWAVAGMVARALELAGAPLAADEARRGEVPIADRPLFDGPAAVRPADWNDTLGLLRLLERHGVDYALVGGYALNFNGLIRQTVDVDVLVSNSPENNRRWISALSELPDGAASELAEDGDDPFSKPGTEGCEDEPGVIRVADVFLVDVMPRACGLTLDELRPYVRRVRITGCEASVLNLEGLRLTKQGLRDKDRSDLAQIEAALVAIRRSEGRQDGDAPATAGPQEGILRGKAGFHGTRAIGRLVRFFTLPQRLRRRVAP